MRDMHAWQHLRPEELFEEMRRASVAYWACGPMEDHGLHNALGVDPLKAHEICRRAAQISGGVVFPLVPVAPAGRSPHRTHRELRERGPAYPPSVFIGVETCEALYAEIFESIAELNFKVCIGFGGHGPAKALLDKVVANLGGRIGQTALAACGSTTFIADIMAEERAKNPKSTVHGSKWETAMNMALCPEHVDLSRARHIEASPIPSQLKGIGEAGIQAIEEATAEFGERLLKVASERLAAFATKLLEEGS